MFGIIFQGLDSFKALTSESAEIFEHGDLWHNPNFSTLEDTAYNLEVFMFPVSLLPRARMIGDKRIFSMYLPFGLPVKFPFDLRILELPHQPYFLGLILSRIKPDSEIESGYKIGGPGCGGPGEPKKSIFAWYPCPEEIRAHLNPSWLDYHPDSDQKGVASSP